MKVVIIHNRYGKFSGEEAVVASQIKILEDNGHTVIPFQRSSEEISSPLQKGKAFFTGIYNPFMAKRLQQIIRESRPDIIHFHNLYPLISPSVLPMCRKEGVPIVMTVHNYRLVCPNGLHMVKGRVCQKCCGGNEWWCVLNNCERNHFKSFGYALRNYVARVCRLFLDNVTVYTCLTDFQKQRLIAAGFPEDRLKVIPNMVCDIQKNELPLDKDFVGFIGRVSHEKGVDTLINCAKVLSTIRFRIAGDYSQQPDIIKNAPDNVEFCGFLQGEELNVFRRQMRLAVMPSRWYETFGFILAEAALLKKPAIASRLGAMAEIVEDGKTGLLFDPDNAQDLAEKIKCLWDRPDLCKKMGEAGREKALREYSPATYYNRMINVYEKAKETCLLR